MCNLFYEIQAVRACISFGAPRGIAVYKLCSRRACPKEFAAGLNHQRRLCLRKRLSSYFVGAWVVFAVFFVRVADLSIL